MPYPSPLPSILVPYIPPSLMRDQQRHTSSITFHSSKIPSYHSYPSTHSFPSPSNLDAKHKSHESNNPHAFKDQHVPSNRHVKTKKNVIQKEKKIYKRPQRPIEQKKEISKTIGVPKVLVEVMHFKELQKK